MDESRESKEDPGPPSKSVQRRTAIQRGEPMPDLAETKAVSQELTDAELGKWLRNLSNAGYWDLEQEDVDRLQTIADRLERPGVVDFSTAKLESKWRTRSGQCVRYCRRFGGEFAVEYEVDGGAVSWTVQSDGLCWGGGMMCGYDVVAPWESNDSIIPAATNTEPTAKA